MKQRGFGLMWVMVILCLVVITAFVALASGMFYFNSAQRVNHVETCFDLNQRHLQEAILRVIEEKSGEENETPSTPSKAIGVQRLDDQRSYALLTFDPTEASRAGIPCSVDNLDGDQPEQGPANLIVPAHHALLLSTAFSGGVKKTRYCYLAMPRFPFALASSGPIQSRGGLLVGGLAPGASLDSSSLDSLAPGHMASNGSSVGLQGPGNRVTGDVRSVGSVALDASAVVEGAVRSEAPEVALPSIRLEDYDPAGLPVLLALEEYNPGLEVRGVARRTGNLHVEGPLVLVDGLVFVEGDVYVKGGLSGRGALVCTGDVYLSGCSAFRANNLAAVLARGVVRVSGDGQSSSYFQGLVYSEKGLEASDVTVLGTALVHGGGEAEMVLENVRAVYDPQAVGLVFDYRLEVGESRGNQSSELGVNPTTGKAWQASDFFQNGVYHPDLVESRLVYEYRGRTFASLDEAVRAMGTQPVRVGPDGKPVAPDWRTFFEQGRQAALDDLTAQLAAFNQDLAAKQRSGLIAGRWSFDLNRFLSVAESTRVIFWKDLN